MRLFKHYNFFIVLVLVLLHQLSDVQAPTTSPTISPTRVPSTVPTVSPTVSPTSAPTCIPTLVPTAVPTRTPTVSPTLSPTVSPTSAPTCIPTLVPTAVPTRTPTVSPTFAPTVSPTVSPTRAPTFSPTLAPTAPTAAPTLVPTLSPTAVPTLAPTCSPTAAPTPEPTNAPTAAPTNSPTAVPTAAPTASPTPVPSSRPSSQPSSRPTSPSWQPTSQPTSRPTIDCPQGKFVKLGNSTVKDVCKSCPDGTTSLNQAFSCTPCGPGFLTIDRISCDKCPDGSISTNSSNSQCSQCKFGQYSDPTGTQCLDCPAGSSSPIPSSTCTLCPLGSFSSLTASSNCTLCPISFYADELGTVSCSSCPPGLITPFLGSTLASACLSPVPNFTFGIFALITAFLMAVYFYLSHFHNTSFMRKERVVNLILVNASQLFRAASKLKTILIASIRHSDNHENDADYNGCFVKTIRVLQFLVFLLVCTIAVCIQIPLMYLIFIARIFYTSFILWRGLQFDLSLNLPPFGEILDTILTAILDVVSIPYFEYLLYIFYPIKYVLIGLAYIKLDLSAVRVTCDGSQAPIKMCFNIAIIGAIIVLVESSYSLTFLVTLKKLYQHLFDVYFFTPGFRAWSKLGLCDFFSFTIYLTIFAFICSCVPFQGILQFLMTFVQIQAFIGGHARNASCDRVEGLYGLDSTLAYWTTMIFYAMIIPAMYSIGRILVPGLPSGKRVFRFLGRNGYFVEKDLYANYTVAVYDIPEAKKSFAETSIMYKYFDAVKSRTNVIVSPDVWFLSKIGLLNLRFLKYKVEKILNMHYADDDIHNADFPADDKLNILDACSMNLKISEAEQLKSMQNTDFPTYMLVSSFVFQEFQGVLGVNERVRERIYFGQPNKVINLLLLILAYSGYGHLLTRVGRSTWILIIWKYFVFLTVSLGIWTEEAVQAFSPELQHARLTLYYHKDIGDSLYAILGLRSVLFQIVPILTILSIFVQNTAKSPLFVFSRKLSTRLPSLFTSMINAKLLALEAELDRLKDLRIDAATNADILDIQEWLISFRAVFLICTTSRIVTFMVNMFVVIMSVGVCYSLQNLKLWIMASIIIIAPIAIATSIATVTSIGTMMHITDRHFNDFNFNFTSKNLLPLAAHYDKKTAKKHDDLGIDIDYYGLFNSKNYKPGEPDEFAELDDPHERPSRTIESLWLSGPVQCEDPPERPSRAVNHGHLFQRNITDTDTEPNSDSGSNDAIDTNPSFVDNSIDVKDDPGTSEVQRNITKTSSSKKIVSNILKLFSSDKSDRSLNEDKSNQNNNVSIRIDDDNIKASNTQDEGDDDDVPVFKGGVKLETLGSSKPDLTAQSAGDTHQADLQFFGAQDDGYQFKDDDESDDPKSGSNWYSIS